MSKVESDIPYSDLSAQSQPEEAAAPPAMPPPYVALPDISRVGTVGPKPQRLYCPSCRADVETQIRHASTSRTHMMALLLCVFSCWLCVCCPYCMDSCRNANHFCPNCGTFIGTYTS